MKRLFYIHDIQDMWLFGSVLKKGDTLVYNALSNKCTSPPKFLNDLGDFKLQSFKGDFDSLNALIDNCDHFITKECLPFTSKYLSANPFVKKRNRQKLISLSWLGESANDSNVYYAAVKNNYKIHFCPPHDLPIYRKLGFKNLSSIEPKFSALNSMNRQRACRILGLSSSQKYATFIISSGGGLAHEGVLKDLYSSKNRLLVNSIYEYCNKNNIKIILKNKLKHAKNREGFKGDIFFEGNNIRYHQTLLLMSISEFTAGFGSSAALEADVLEAPYINFTAVNPYRDAALPYGDWFDPSRQGLCHVPLLAQGSSIFSIYPKDDLDLKGPPLLSFLNQAKPPNFLKKYPLHPIFK